MAPMKMSPGKVELHKPFKIVQAKLEGAKKKTNNKKIINLPRSETGWVTGGVGRFVGAAGGTAEPYIFALSPDSAFPLAPDTTVGMGFPIDKSFVVSSFIPAIAAKEYNYIDM